MTLFIDTTLPEYIILELQLKNASVIRKKIKTAKRQGEKLIPSLASLLSANKLRLRDIKKISVVNQGGSFTALRIGVITANALAYALNIPIEASGADNKSDKNLRKFGSHKIVVPQYYSLPEIGKSKKGII